FASEMIVKATLQGLKISEVPTTLSPDGRGRPPHLRSWRDGWRHLRFLLLFSPRWLFFYPGCLLFLCGLAVMGWLLPGPRQVGGDAPRHPVRDFDPPRVPDRVERLLHQRPRHPRDARLQPAGGAGHRSRSRMSGGWLDRRRIRAAGLILLALQLGGLLFIAAG